MLRRRAIEWFAKAFVLLGNDPMFHVTSDQLLVGMACPVLDIGPAENEVKLFFWLLDLPVEIEDVGVGVLQKLSPFLAAEQTAFEGPVVLLETLELFE